LDLHPGVIGNDILLHPFFLLLEVSLGHLHHVAIGLNQNPLCVTFFDTRDDHEVLWTKINRVFKMVHPLKDLSLGFGGSFFVLFVDPVFVDVDVLLPILCTFFLPDQVL